MLPSKPDNDDKMPPCHPCSLTARLLLSTQEENGSSGLWPTITSFDLFRIMKSSDGVARYRNYNFNLQNSVKKCTCLIPHCHSSFDMYIYK